MIKILAIVLVGVFSCKKQAESNSKVSQSGASTEFTATIHGIAVNNKGVEVAADEGQMVSYHSGAFGFDSGTFSPVPGNDNTAFALAAGDTPYMKKCRAAGVPIPPPATDPKWKKSGIIPRQRLNISRSLVLRLKIYLFL